MVNRQDVSPSEGATAERPPGAVEALIERFGGLRPMADKLAVPVSTVQGWKKRGAIPANRQADIRAAMEKLNLGDPETALEGVFRHEDAPAAESAPVAEEPAAPPVEAPAAEVTAPPVVEIAAPPVLEVAAPPVIESVIAAPPAEQNMQTPPVEKPIEKIEEVPVTETSVAAAAAVIPEDKPQAPQGAGHGTGQGAGAAVAAAILAVVGAAVSVTAPLWSHEYLQRSINVAVIEKRTSDAETALGLAATQRTALDERVGAVEKTLAALEGRVARAPAVAGALAVRDLRQAFAAGAPFAAESAAVRASGLAGKDEDALFAALAPYADKGVPTRATVNERFAWTASAIVGGSLTSLLPAVPTDLPAKVWGWASGVAGAVTQAAGAATQAATDAAGRINVGAVAEALRLREPGTADAVIAAPPAEPAPAPAAPAPAPTVEAAAPPAAAATTEAPANDDAAKARAAAALLAEAGNSLRQGDLLGAVAAVARLEGPAAEQAADWLADARARLAADKLTAALAERTAKALQ